MNVKTVSILMAILFLTSILSIAIPVRASTIQGLINAASPSSTITLAAGTYSEGDIHINKPLTIQGAGTSLTVIDATSKSKGFFIEASDVTIKDLTIQGATHHNIHTDMTVSDVTIDNIESLNSYYGLEIHNNAEVTNLVITNSLFSGNTGNGMRIRGKADGVTITDSNFDNNEQGMAVYGSADNVEIIGSTFNNNDATGVNLWTGGFGIYAGYWSPRTPPETITNWRIVNCQFNENDGHPIGSGFNHGIVFDATGTTISEIKISHSEFLDNDNVGIEIGGSDPIDDISIERSEFSGSQIAVQILGATGIGSDISIHYNIIDGNTLHGVDNNILNPTVDAEYNWWGDASGPSGEGPGTGDAVSVNVDFDPWLMVPPVIWYVDEVPPGGGFNDVEAFVTKIYKAISVEFIVEIISENVPHGVYGMGIAVSTDIDLDIDSFQVWYAEYMGAGADWFYQDYPWTSPYSELTASGTGITATGEGILGEKVFTVDIPFELLYGSAPYYFAIQFRTNLLGTYPSGLDLWAQTDANLFEPEIIPPHVILEDLEDEIVLDLSYYPLYVNDGSTDWDEVSIPVDIAIEDIYELSFWEKIDLHSTSGWDVNVILGVDCDGDGDFEADIEEWHIGTNHHTLPVLHGDSFVEMDGMYGVINYGTCGGLCGDLGWTEVDAYNAPGMGWAWWTPNDLGTGFASFWDGAGLDDFQAWLDNNGDDSLIDVGDRVKVLKLVIGGSGSWMDETAYVDLARINGETVLDETNLIEPLEKRQVALIDKIDDVIAKINVGDYKGALCKLEKDIRPKLDGVCKHTWAKYPLTNLLDKIDAVVDILEALL